MHSCVGKHLALNELRLVLARTVLAAEIELGASYNEKQWQEDWRDYFTLQVGAVPVKFTLRN
jgi:cytochrome P450